MNVIRKAILPVAGLGTRFLPATKTVPKEMLTIVDRPVVEYIVEEARAAGIEHLIFVTGRSKGLIEDHFDRHPELEDALTTARHGGETDRALPRSRGTRRAPSASRGSRWRSGSGMPSGALGNSSATNPSPFSCPTCCTSRATMDA